MNHVTLTFDFSNLKLVFELRETLGFLKVETENRQTDGQTEYNLIITDLQRSPSHQRSGITTIRQWRQLPPAAKLQEGAAGKRKNYYRTNG